MQKSNQLLGSLLETWNKARGQRAMPQWSGFDARALRPWLGHLALVECLGSDELRFRLCGTNLHARLGGEFTRCSLAALDPEIGAPLCLQLAQVLQSRAPIWAHFDRAVAGKRVHFLDLYLPLSDDAASVSLVLFASYPQRSKVAS